MRGRPVLTLALLVVVLVAVYALAPRPDRIDHLTAARAALDRRDFPTARRELDAHLAQHPRDPDARLLAARTARRADDAPAAEQHLTAYLEIGGDPRHADFERTLAQSQAGDADPDAVLKFCDDHPDHPDGPLMLEALARGLLATRRPGLAILPLDRWLARDLPPGDRLQALLWRAEALEQIGRVPEASEDYRRVLALDPGRGHARLRLAVFLIRDQPAEALAHYEQLDRAEPGRFEVLFGMARAHRQLGHHEAAGQLLARVRPMRPDDVDVLMEVGALALDRGRPAEAEAPLRRAVELAPTLREPNAQLLRCLQELGRDAEAAEQRAKVKRIYDDLVRKIEAIRGGP